NHVSSWRRDGLLEFHGGDRISPVTRHVPETQGRPPSAQPGLHPAAPRPGSAGPVALPPVALKPRVLIVDDDGRRRALLSQVLASGYDCHTSRTLDDAFFAVDRWAWEVALVDYDLGPHCSGLELLQAMREISPAALRILYTEHYCDGLVRDATRIAGAHAVVDAREPEFVPDLHGTLARLLLRPSPVPAPAREEEGSEPAWFAESARSREFASRLRAAAERDGPVFLYGEHGTGKHLAATVFRRWR